MTHPSALLRELSARPDPRLSQSFLCEPAVADAMVGAAELTDHDDVLEIGPGLGLLTQRLVRVARTVVAVEVDPTLAEALPSAVGNVSNLKLVRADALALDLGTVVAEPYVVVSSLPYHVASPILFKLFFAPPRPTRAVVMVQDEVAARLVARPGAMTYLGAVFATVATTRLVRRVAPGSFFPVPKVRSAIIHMESRPTPAVAVDSVERFATFLRAGFTQPRKQLHNSLGPGLKLSTGTIQMATRDLSIDSRRRPGELSLDEWAALYGVLRHQIES